MKGLETRWDSSWSRGWSPGGIPEGSRAEEEGYRMWRGVNPPVTVTVPMSCWGMAGGGSDLEVEGEDPGREIPLLTPDS